MVETGCPPVGPPVTEIVERLPRQDVETPATPLNRPCRVRRPREGFTCLTSLSEVPNTLLHSTLHHRVDFYGCSDIGID